MFASGCRATVFEPRRSGPSGQRPGLASDSGCRSFGKAQAGVDVRGQPQNRCAVCQNHACRGAEDAPGLLSGRCGRNFCNGLEATPDRPRRARESHLSWCTTSSRAFFGRRRAASLLLGATPVRPLPGGSHACRGAWMRAVALSGAAGRIQSPGACSRAATSCENQKICACRGQDASNGSFGNRRTAPGDWNHPPAPPRPVRQSAVRNANVPPAPSGGLVCSRPLRGTRSKRLVGRSVHLPPEVRCEAQCAVRLSREVRSVTKCASKPTVPLLGGGVEALRSDGNQLRRWRCRCPPGYLSPPNSDGPMDAVEGPGSPRCQLYHSTRRTREGGAVSAG